MRARFGFCALVIVLVAPAVRSAEPPMIGPRGLPGPLVLTGGRDIPKAVREAFLLLAGKEKASIVVIPTAFASADDPKETAPLLRQWEDLGAASVVLLHTRDPKKADDPEFVKPLTEATAVWFTNGHTDRILNAYRGTLFEKELKKLHARGGVIGAAGGGTSAMGSLAFAGGAPKPTEGFGLLPGFLVEHKDRALDAIAENPTCVGLCIPEGAGVVIYGRVAGVIAEVPVTVCLAKGAGRATASDEHKAGALLDLIQLRRAALGRAAKEPFPPAKPGEPVLAKGRVIAGGGELHADVWKRFIELAGGPDATIVVVPTARVRPLRLGDSEEDALKQFGAKNVVMLHTTDRKEADDPKFSEILTKAGGVWFTGGRQWRLIDAYEGTLTEKRFHALLARGGVIGGGSAGASIQGEYMPRGHPLGNDVMSAEGYERGFGFLPGCAVDQHFFALERTADMTKLMQRYPQYLGVGVDERAALVVSGRTAEVLGKGSVAFYDAKRKPEGTQDYEELFPKEKYDLKERKKIK